MQSCEVKERPILFSGPMVRAILEGRKTQTRRIVKPQPEHRGEINGEPAWYWKSPRYDNGDGVHYLHTDDRAARRLMLTACPYGRGGDRLWVREGFGFWHKYMSRSEAEQTPIPAAPHALDPSVPFWSDRLIYRADGEPDPCNTWVWRPSIHMPRWASRLTLEITDVRVQRLQDISEEDAEAEGCGAGDDGLECECGWIGRESSRGVKRKENEDDVSFLCPECGKETAHWPIDKQARMDFRLLWDSINGDRAPWQSDPLVWAVTFRKIS